MLKNKILAVATLCMSIAAGVAHAGAFDNTRFILGSELSLLNYTSYSSANTPDLNNFRSSNSDSKLAIRKNKPGFNFFAAARITENVGVEIGYGFIFKVTSNVQNNRKATNTITNTYIDFVPYLPVAAKVDLVGNLGIGMLKCKANVSGATFNNLDSLNKAKLGIRVGGGAQYNINNNWSSRAMLRYQKGNKNFLRSVTSMSIGMLYTF